MIRVLQSNDKVTPEVVQEDVMKMNYLRLALTLKKLALKDDIDLKEKLEIAKNLQRQFTSQENADFEEDQNEMSD